MLFFFPPPSSKVATFQKERWQLEFQNCGWAPNSPKCEDSTQIKKWGTPHPPHYATSDMTSEALGEMFEGDSADGERGQPSA